MDYGTDECKDGAEDLQYFEYEDGKKQEKKGMWIFCRTIRKVMQENRICAIWYDH